MTARTQDKRALFEELPIRKALATMAVPTIISQLINLVYNVVDAFFIGRTGNPYMAAATTLSWTLVMLNTALSNLYGVGGGSLLARLMGAGRDEEAGRAVVYIDPCIRRPEVLEKIYHGNAERLVPDSL